MSNDILVIAEHLDGKVADISYEMTGKARELAAALGGKVTVALLGQGMAGQAGGFASDATLVIDDPALANFNPEAYGRVIAALIAARAPRLTMLGSTSSGMDLTAWLAVRSSLPCVASVNQLAAEGDELRISSQIYGGKVAAQVSPEGGRAVVAVMAGAFPAAAGRGAGPVEQSASPVSLDGLRVTFSKLIRPEAGDIDITTYDKLVSVGRGIGGQENIELAQELAGALGAALSGSRPIIDAGWLPKTRQVGKSGLSVKPKLYLMLGISGAPEHLEGMKDAELILAVNSDPKAPIFDVAHYGSTCDLFEVTEALLEALG
ncbi:electron transfer flavoprotein subunit alpha/FixB family protein [Chloroflexales bacterium ZM16-3]|nr:electron transfer flavoprotein subunit alpha/FixB family protein [Chloroflexales bacterium ZM16-3]